MSIALQQKEPVEAAMKAWFIKNIRSGIMSVYSAHRSGGTGMKRFPYLIVLASLLLIFLVTVSSAASPITTTPGMTGGSVYFDTNPPVPPSGWTTSSLGKPVR